MNSLFIILPSYSHINAVLHLARETSKKQTVYFLGSLFSRFNRYIQEQGFILIECSTIPFGMNYFDELTFYRHLNLDFTDLLKNRISGNLIEARLCTIRNIVDQYNIQQIFLDSFIGADFLSYYEIIIKNDIELLFVTTMNPLIHFRDGFKTKIKSLNKTSLVKNGITYVWQWLFLAGYTSAKLIDTMIRHHGLSYNRIKLFGKCGIVFFGFSEIVFADREMVPREIRDTTFIGPCVDVNRIEYISNSDRELLKNLFKNKSQIIYISFGTLYESSFFNKLVVAVKMVASQLKNFHFIIANSPFESKIPNHFFHLATENVHFMRLAPQLLLLSKSIVFITHGGFNSLKEALHFGIPTIVIPSSNYFDQEMAGGIIFALNKTKLIERKNISEASIISAICYLLKGKLNNDFTT